MRGSGRHPLRVTEGIACPHAGLLFLHRADRERDNAAGKGPVNRIGARMVAILNPECDIVLSGHDCDGFVLFLEEPVEFHAVKPAESRIVVQQVNVLADGMVFGLFRERGRL